jgi:UDPglucose--hexose-1-phosphate uridylyltransferase
MENKIKKFPSEIRYDVVSQDWVIVATGRAKRPEAFKVKKKEEIAISEKECPFCNVETQEKPVLIFEKGKIVSPKKDIPKNWTTIVIPNKYPALLPAKKIEIEKEGKFYRKITGAGYCELVIPRDHYKNLHELEVWQIKEILDCYQKRYLSLMKKPFVNYISIFHNSGKEAGASQPHPHSQIITTPLIDADLKKTLIKSKNFYQTHKKCIYCEMNTWEVKVKKRIVVENDDFLALCPFASKSAFQVIISPKFHSPYFEKITEKEKQSLAEIFSTVIKKIAKGLNCPPYNFYLHTAPCDGKKYPYYHWHFTILPKLSIPAGFELGTKMEICMIEPETSTSYLRKTKI